MKKAMLFFAALLFSINVNAASLNLVQFENDVNTNSTNLFTTFDSVQAISTSSVNGSGFFEVGHIIESAVDTWVNIEWSFNKKVNLLSASISKGEDFVLVQPVTGEGISFSFLLLAGQTYFFDIAGQALGQPLTTTLTVSAVPVPAALWLFAPALMGFFGLRRKAKLAAA